MPVMFPEYDPNDPGADPVTGLVERPFLEVDEVAALLHVSDRTVRDRCASGQWPCVEIVTGRRYMRPEQVGRIIALSTHDVAELPDLPPPTLGVPLEDRDTEGVQ